MQTPSSTLRVGGLNRSVPVAVVALAVLALAGAAGSSFAQGAEALRIDVTLDEYSFSPEPLRIPAGRPVTLVISNVGKVAHEFMAGRDAEGNDFTEDLFADLHVNIEQADAEHAGHNEDAEHAEHAEHAGHADHDADAGHADHDADAGHADHDADAGHADHDADAGHAEHAEHAAQSAGAQEHAHGEGHAHGTMVEARAGETFLMTFTLPEDRRGEWASGCFLSGHYEAGMHGTVIVE